MAKMGKTSTKAVGVDTQDRQQRRDNADKGFARFYKQRKGFNWFRVMPAAEGRELPWEKGIRHFQLGPNNEGFCNCAGKGCPACALVKALFKSKKKSDKARGDNMKRSFTNYIQLIDVSPMYDVVDGKVKRNKKNNFPKCFGEIEYTDDDREVLSKKCRKCKKKTANSFGVSWADACDYGLCVAGLSGQRIDDIADGFDEGDLTDIGKEGRTVQVKRKGEGRFKTSYKVKVLNEEWALPKYIKAYIADNFIDLVDLAKPATKDEMKAIMEGRDTEDGDTPDCWGEFDDDEEKCKDCDIADLCAEEAGYDANEEEDEEGEDEEEDEDDDEDGDDEDGDDEDDDDDDDDDNDSDDDTSEEDEDDDDDDDEDDDEDDDSDDDDEDDDEDDDDEDDEDDEEEESAKEKLKKKLKKKSKKKSKPKGKKKMKKAKKKK